MEQQPVASRPKHISSARLDNAHTLTKQHVWRRILSINTRPSWQIIRTAEQPNFDPSPGRLNQHLSINTRSLGKQSNPTNQLYHRHSAGRLKQHLSIKARSSENHSIPTKQSFHRSISDHLEDTSHHVHLHSVPLRRLSMPCHHYRGACTV